jgi:Tol biopolymer transport system component
LWPLTIGRFARAAAPIKINAPLAAGGSLLEAQFSPDSSRVMYRADQALDGLFEIFVVPSTGGTALKLNGTLVANGDVLAAQFSPDSSRVLYHADQTANDVFEIYSVPSGGGTPIPLNNPLVVNGDVSSVGFQFSPDSSRVLFHADQTVDEVFEIFSVPSAGGTVTKLNGVLVANGDVTTSDLQFSPDSSRVLYQADQSADEVFEIFSVPSAGGAAVKLNGTLAAGGDVISQQFSPDSSRVLYRADQTTNDVNEIFSVASAGGPVVKLNGALVAGGQVNSDGLQFSPNSSRVLYQADQTTDGVLEIYSVPSAGGVAVKLNGPLVLGGDVDEQLFSPNSSRVVYDADQTIDDVVEIFSVPATGGAAVKLNGPMAAGGDVTGFYSFTPDSSRVVYTADQVTNDVRELFSVPGTGGTAVKLSGTLVAGGEVLSSGLQFSSDSSRVLYMADQITDEVTEIFIVPTTGGTAVKLNGSLVPGGDVSFVQLSPDSSLVLYMADQDADQVEETYVRIVRQHSRSGAGNWDAGAAWDHGGEPDNVMQVFVDGPGTVTATGAGARTVNELVIGGGAGNSTLALADGAGISSLHGATIRNGGILRGDGTLVANLVVQAGGEIRAGAGERLSLSSAALANAGRIEAIGTGFSPAEIEFDGAVTNSAGTGNIVARNAVLRFHGGLTNNSALAVSFGTTDVLGDVSNSATGTIAVAGNSGATFYDDVTNSGAMNVHAGSTAVFFGALAGNGNIGSGDVQALGDLLPGASPGTMAFGGNLSLGPLTNLEIELGGLVAGSQFDQLVVAGDATLAGTLDVSLIDDFALSLGDAFEIIDITGALSGTFAGLAEGDSVGNFGGTSLRITYAGGDGNDVALFVPGLPGDFNFDGAVDAADYVFWRKTGINGPTGYDTWRSNFGESGGSGSVAGANTTVPEPTTLLMLMFVVAGWFNVRHPAA